VQSLRYIKKSSGNKALLFLACAKVIVVLPALVCPFRPIREKILHLLDLALFLALLAFAAMNFYSQMDVDCLLFP